MSRQLTTAEFEAMTRSRPSYINREGERVFARILLSASHRADTATRQRVAEQWLNLSAKERCEYRNDFEAFVADCA